MFNEENTFLLSGVTAKDRFESVGEASFCISIGKSSVFNLILSNDIFLKKNDVFV